MLLSRSLKLAVLGLAVMVAGCDRQSGDKAQPPATTAANTAPAADAQVGALDTSHKGSPLPAFTLSDAAGHKLALGELKGKPLLINLWATWCAPCVAELPQLDSLAGSGNLRVLAISQDMGDGAKVADFLKQRGVSHLEPWLDPQNDLAAHFGANTLPMSVLYDAEGNEVWRTNGPRDWASAETTKLLGESAN